MWFWYILVAHNVFVVKYSIMSAGFLARIVDLPIYV